MDVQNAIWKGSDKNGRKESHEAGEAHHVDFVLPKLFQNPFIESLPRGKRFVVDDRRRNIRFSRSFETLCVASVTDNDSNSRVETTLLDGIDYGLKVGTPPRNQNAQRAAVSAHKVPS